MKRATTVMLLAAAFAAAAPADSRAQVLFEGQTYGCFYHDIFSGCTPQSSDSFRGDLAFDDVRFEGTSFSTWVTEDGSWTAALPDLGSIGLNNIVALPDEYSLNDWNFILAIAFTDPTGDVLPFDAEIRGRIETDWSCFFVFCSVDDGFGTIRITWDTPFMTFGPDNQYAVQLNNFEMVVNEATGSALNQYYAYGDLTGQFSAVAPYSATPEPATMVLMLTGLAGVGAHYRRRRKHSALEE